MGQQTSENWTTRTLLDAATAHLEAKGIDSPRLAAELLLAHVFEVPRINLYMDLDRPTSDLERAAYRSWIEKAAAHHPVQYLMGEAHFFSMKVAVKPGVLIPRPSTEVLVEHVIQHCRNAPGFGSSLIADIGTGSGCIAVALAKNMPDAHVVATDINPVALEVGAANAESAGVTERVEFRSGPLYEPLGGERCQFVVSNPPYIPDHEWDAVPSNVKDHEPVEALRGGPEGLDVIEPLIRQAPDHLAPDGQLVVEIAACQRDAVIGIVEETDGLTHPHVHADHEGHHRMLIASREAG